MEIYHIYEGIPRFLILAIVVFKYFELLDKKLDSKTFIKGVILYTIFAQIAQIGIYYFYYNNLLVARDIFSTVFTIITVFGVPYLTFGKYRFLDNLVVIVVADLLVETFASINLFVIKYIIEDLLKSQLNIISANIMYFSVLISVMIPCFLFWKKMKNISILEIFNTKKSKITIAILEMVLVLLVNNPFLEVYFKDKKLLHMVVYIIPMLIASIYIIIYALTTFSKKNTELRNTIMQQQEAYISSLESMQEDIRKYNHDYKNLLTGALLQAEEGDYEGVQNYLQDVLDEFELKLGKQISKNTQLKKINSNALKGLLLSKILKMEDKGIEFHLEVLNEVDKINMKSTDLVRCLGILLDNAMEEVEKIEEKIISLVILQEENITTIMVKNPVTEKINIQSIYEDNYSTKGAKRGLGLSNYREIVENYENIVRETICTEEEFNQILKIG